MWKVVLVKSPKTDVYRSGYFPRKVRYKKDAMELVKEVEKNGGVARLEKA